MSSRGFNQPQRRDPAKRWPKLQAHPGVVLRHRTTNYVGAVVRFSSAQVVLRDMVSGREHTLPVAPGAFSYKGRTVTLIRPPAKSAASKLTTASGSVAVRNEQARVARQSRILVEGVHDAELVEKIWGDDLRVEGVVVVPLHGADDLVAIVDDFDPGPHRRLGILLDHMVDHTKEQHLAKAVASPYVLVTGHPFVDIWQAIKPQVIGIHNWPTIPRGKDWKTGVSQAWGFDGSTGELWSKLLSQVSNFADLEPSLVGAVESLIDFIAPPGDLH